jgi:predicted TIM-barrel fold metal-dependent hydrolase
MQRFNGLFAGRKDLQEKLPNGPAYYMERFFYDTAMANTAPPLSALLKVTKPAQIVFGTDFPFGSSLAVAAALRQSGLFNADDLQAIERGNAARIMPRFRT